MGLTLFGAFLESLGRGISGMFAMSAIQGRTMSHDLHSPELFRKRLYYAHSGGNMHGKADSYLVVVAVSLGREQ
jgi:hypothetical protein